MKVKYLQGHPRLACDRQDGSQFWRAIQSIKHEIHMGARFSIGDGEGTLFWHDPWLDDMPLRVKFPSLFAICSDPAQLVASAVHNGSSNISFRRTFRRSEAAAWDELRCSLPVSVPGGQDRVSWRLSPSGTFSLKTAYRGLFSGPPRSWAAHLWKALIPLKIKIFFWQLLRDCLPSGVEVSK